MCSNIHIPQKSVVFVPIIIKKVKKKKTNIKKYSIIIMF